MSTVTAVAIVFALVIVGLDRFGLLDWIKPKSASDAEAELQIADRTIDRLRHERNEAITRANQLALERTNEPVLEVLSRIADQLAQSADSQSDVLDRLARHNGSFAHMEASLGVVADGLKALMGTIAELHDLPMKENP